VGSRDLAKALMAATTMTAVSLLVIVLIGVAPPSRMRPTEAAVATPAIGPACIASSQHVPESDADRSGARARGAFAAAASGCMTAMHTGMARAFEAQRSADVIFATAMVPHHQGGIDMARQLLLYGKDPELRALALGVIAEQQAEIAMLRIWIVRHPDVDAPPSDVTARRSPRPTGVSSR
jgi:hypothetical protein